MILLMPTWRGSGYPSGDAFYDTEYCRSFRSLLASPELARLLEESDTRLVFYPHIEMQRYIDCFRAGSDLYYDRRCRQPRCSAAAARLCAADNRPLERIFSMSLTSENR